MPEKKQYMVFCMGCGKARMAEPESREETIAKRKDFLGHYLGHTEDNSVHDTLCVICQQCGGDGSPVVFENEENEVWQEEDEHFAELAADIQDEENENG